MLKFSSDIDICGASLYTASNPQSVISNLTLTILSLFTAPESYNSLAFKTVPVILIILVLGSCFSGVLGVLVFSWLLSPSLPAEPLELSMPPVCELPLIVAILFVLELSDSFSGCCGGIIVLVSSFKSEAYNEI